MTSRRPSLFLIRHAHRVAVDPTSDNGLSEKGLVQAQKLAREIQSALSIQGPPPTTRILSSPKVRCIETLEPLCQLLGVPLELSNECIEQQRTEETKQFEMRVETYLTQLVSDLTGQFTAQLKGRASKDLVICSHGDWLPVATKFLLGRAVEFKNAQWVEIKL